MSIEKAFDFTADDLAANKSGKLSARQEEKRAKRRRTRRWATRLALFFFIGTEAVIIAILLMNTEPFDESNRDMLTAYAIFLALYNGIILFAMLYGYSRGRDLRRGAVSQVEGPIKLRVKKYRHESNLPNSYYGTIGKVKFQFETTRQHDMLQDGAPYRIYYVNMPPTGWILSIEAIESV